MLIILIPATVLIVIWLALLFQVDREDWVAAAYNKVLDDRTQVEKLRAADERNAKKLEQYHGIARKVMRLFLGGNSEKKIQKLLREAEELQGGRLKSVSILPMPGYVLQRRFQGIGHSSIYRMLLGKNIELYGRKYADKKTRQLLAQVLSYPMIGISAALALGSLLLGLDKQTEGLAVIGIGSLLVLGLTYAVYDEVDDQLKKRRTAISRQFPNVVSKLALLVTSGMIMDRAWKETAQSQDTELYLEMRKTSDELDNLVEPSAAYTNFINRCNTKETTKLASAIIQNLSKGNAEIGVLLKGMAHDAWQERRHMAKRDSEAANAKLMIPTFLLFIAILVMIMVPVVTNFSGF